VRGLAAELAIKHLSRLYGLAVNWLAFSASALHSLAWPAGAVVMVAMLRRPIGMALGRGIRRLRAGPVEVEFDEKLAEIHEEIGRGPDLPASPGARRESSLLGELGDVAAASPKAAVLEAFGRIEARLREMLAADPNSTTRIMSPVELARLGSSSGVISDETRSAIEGLWVLRNLAAHSPGESLSVDRAMDFLALADAVLYALRAKNG
jgi:hypothetical protein